jgi:hypothetical protein
MQTFFPQVLSSRRDSTTVLRGAKLQPKVEVLKEDGEEERGRYWRK